MVLGLDAERALRKHLVVDERSAGFFALGQARATGRPTALLCTSGTAAAHYLPAVAEASLARVPLVLLSADRPWEAYDCGASQTMDQVKLFGDQVRHYAELGLPDAAALPAVQRVAAQAVLRSRWPDPGPVHINARFRKPLEPVEVSGPEPHAALVERLLEAGPPVAFPPREQVDPDAIDFLVRALRGCSRGLIVAGPSLGSSLPLLREVLPRLCAALGFPLLAETTSGLRALASVMPVVTSFDVLFRSPAFLARHAPDFILEIGMPPVSTAYAAWLASQPQLARVVIAPRGWNDPHGTASALLLGDPAAYLHELSLRANPEALDPAWAPTWHRAAAIVEGLVKAQTEASPLCEGAVARSVAQALGPGVTLLLGNSGPVRDIDLYGTSVYQIDGDLAPHVLHQRGAAGIDGLIAGGAGAASVSGGRPVVVYLGDISLQHDLGSLHLAARASEPLVIVVTNNDGGRIFEQLPLARRSEVKGAFERYFITPHGGNFEGPARAAGLWYREVTERGALQEALAQAAARPAASLIEARVPPEQGAQERTRLWRQAAELLGDLG
jgi:2-succinyl-5-enolpyruvyl-6-hydroxy-3-cyclohexene-1-carboxylate synthase